VRYDYYVTAPIRSDEYCQPLVSDPLPELEIVEVLAPTDIAEPWVLIPVTALVRNQSSENVAVRLAVVRASLYPGDEPLIGLEVGSETTIPPGRVAPLVVNRNPSNFRLEEVYPAPLEIRVFLVEPDIDPEESLTLGTEPESVFRSSWKDPNVCNNYQALSLSIPPPTHWSVYASLDRLSFDNSCDHVSPGDWFFDVRICLGGSTPSGCPRDPSRGYWPERPLDIGSGDVLTLDRFSELGAPGGGRDFLPGQRVNVEVVGWECDAGGFAEHRIQCRNAEEAFESPEVPKGTAFGGRSSVVFAPRRPGVHTVPISFPASNLPAFPSYENHCGNGAFSAQGVVEVTPRWYPE